jgi:hypothetical protein
MNVNINVRKPAIARLAVSIAAACCALSAHATEQLFPETYLAEVLPKGALEAEQWLTYREGKSQGTYGLMQSRTELEYGITSRWMASLYINTYSVNAHNNNSSKSRTDYTSTGGDGDEVTGGGPATFGPYVPNSSRFPVPSAYYGKTDFDSVSVETIYNFMSPYSDGIGLSGYFEYTYGDKIQEIELKALLQKNLMDDRLILAANFVVELEKNSYSLVATEKETEIEFTGGASYRVGQHFRVGLEARNIQGFSGYSAASGNHAYSIWYAGPVVSFSVNKFFAVLGYQYQLPWAEAFNHAAQNEQISGQNFYEYEKNFVRLKFGMSFR